MEFSNEFLATLTQFEGSTNYMYLDTTGNVTVGVGHLIDSPAHAAALPLRGPDTFHDWCRVKRALRGQLAAYYKRCSSSRLSPRGIAIILESDLDAVSLQLTARLPCFPALPLPVQHALCDMAFNLGTAKLIEDYPKMIACVEAGDWNGAAAQCHRNGIAQERNDWCASMFSSDTNPHQL